ncbi:MAG: toll/interleukin-1 receptor domain-containing protein [Microscillaceae bacterium]|jgi:hypothetical protein|nr:toll/interleukin-1 receptor domain-containing protein [Microscillaceae bacterium]
MSETIHDVFISYSTKDQIPKNYIKDVFDREGISYFLDEISLELGQDIQESLETNLKNTRFTVLLVSKNSLFSTWVCLESIHRLQEESFTKKTTFLPVLVDLSVMSLDFPLEMAKHFKAKLEELEAKRVEAKSLGISTKMYNDEIERIEKVLPQISDIIQKIKNGLSANFADDNRKTKDLEKLLKTIKADKIEASPTQPNQLQILPYAHYDQTTELDRYCDIDLANCLNDSDVVSNDLRFTDYQNDRLIFQAISDQQAEIWFGFEYPQPSVFVKFALGTTFQWDKNDQDYSYVGLVFTAWNEGYFHKLVVNNFGEFLVYYDTAQERVDVSNGWHKMPHIKPKQGMTYHLAIVVVYPEGVDDLTDSPCNIEYYVNDEIVFIFENTHLLYLPYYFGVELSAGSELGIEYLQSSKPA